jgi:hypothetical protein
MNVRIALTITSVLALGPVAAAGAHTTSVNPCTFLSTKQVAAVHVDTGCKVLHGRANPLYDGVVATWGKAGGKGSVIVSVDRAKSHTWIDLWKSSHVSGKSWGVGNWSAGTCTTNGLYCYVSFIVGNNVVVLQVAPPGAKPISVVKPSKAMAKTIAAKLA